MASVHFQDLSQKFIECFFENATKTETLDPIFTDNVVASIQKKEISTKAEVLKALEAFLPLEKINPKVEIYQPFNTGSVLTVEAKNKDKNYALTFTLKEVDTTVHRFGIDRFILIEKC